MSITSRINEIETHLKEDYTNLEALGYDIPQDKNIENIASVLDNVWENQSHIEETGTTLSMNTNKGKAKVDLLGNTYQETTTGKNLFDKDNANIVYNARLSGTGTVIINDADATGYYVSDYIKVNQNVDVVNNETLGYPIRVCLYDENKTFIQTYSSGTSFNTGNAYYLMIGGKTSLIDTKQVEYGSTATDYEPYTGGQPAPNPQFPMPIQVVSGDNTITSCGKNLLDTNVFKNRRINCYTINDDNTITQTATDTNFWQNSYLPYSIILNSGTYTISVDNRNGSTLQVYNLTTNSNIVESHIDSYTFTLTNDNQVFNVKLYGASSYPFTFTMQVETGSTATTYEPYQGNTYPIYLGVENLFDNSVERKSAFTTGNVGQQVGYSNSTATYSFVNCTYLEANQTYTFNWNKNTPSSTSDRDSVIVDANNIILEKPRIWTNNSETYTFTPTHSGYLILVFDKYSTDIQITKGTTPQHISNTPIELCEIGNYQDKFIRNSGKNLFDKTTITTSAYLKEDGTLQTGTGAEYITSDFIPIKPNTTYYKTLTLSPRTKFYDANKQVLDTSTYQDISIGGNAGSFTTPSNAYYFRFTGNVNTSTGININTTMVNEGSASIPYEPYGNGEWYLKKNINKIILNGTDYPLYGDGGSSNDYWEYSRTGMTGGIGTQDSVKTNYFNQTTNSRIVILSNGGMYFRFPKASGIDVSTNTLLNTWLSTHNTIVDYVLATPTYTKIEGTLASQLEDVWRANTYDNQTNVSQVNNDLPFELYFKALGTPSNTLLGLSRNLQLNNPIENVEEIEESGDLDGENQENI